MNLHQRLALPLFAAAIAVTLAGVLGAILLVNRTFRLTTAIQERQVARVVENVLTLRQNELAAVATVMAILDGDARTRLGAWKHIRLDSAAILDAKSGRVLSSDGVSLDPTDLRALPAAAGRTPLLLRGGGKLFLAAVKPDRNRSGLAVLAAVQVKPELAASLKGLLQGDVALNLDGKEMISTAASAGRRESALVAPLRTPGGGEVLFQVFVPRNDINRERRNALGMVVAGGVILLFAGLLFYNWSLSRVTKPIRELAAAADRIASGDLAARLPEGAPAELGELIGRFNDMARRLREAQEKLVHSAKLSTVGQMVAGVSHELNNPLLGLITHAEVQATKLGTDSPGRAELDVIMKEAQRMKKILGELRDMSRPGSGERVRLDLNAVVRDVAGLLRHQCAKANITMETSLAPGELPVTASPDGVRQVLLNLALNSLEAMPKGGTLKLSAKAEGPRALASVADTGTGISGENIRKSMEPFFTTKPGRMGLGLAISREIAVTHGGRISLQSNPGQGTIATLELPLA